MGSVKENMTPKSDKTKTLFGLIRSKRKKTESIEETAKTFSDKLTDLDTDLQSLILTKQKELELESGEEVYNRLALSHLLAIQFHLDSIIENAVLYSELKK